ncbi:MAG TPA: SdrD B-like domain-containing protein, partial [Candidatus Methanoperedens sp.]|nr:SdrD B-like domain-containing protein [Candidatus Methanoperedens sp.]
GLANHSNEQYTRIIRGRFDIESDSQQNFDSKIQSILSNASGNNIDPDHLVLSSSYLTDKSDDLSIMKYVQKFKGLNIHSSRIIVGIKNGKVVTLKSNYYPEKDIDTETTLSKEDIIEIIEKDIGFQLIKGGLRPHETFSFEELEANKSAFVRKKFNLENRTTVEDILLVIYPEPTRTEIKYHLTYKVELGLSISPPSKWVYFIDANNGEILEKYNKVVFNILSGHVTGRIYPEYPNQSIVVRNFWNETLYDFTDHLSNIFWSGKNDNLDNYIFTKNPISITNVSSATLEFKSKFLMENEHSFGYVVLSTDGRNYSNFEEYTGTKADWSTIKIDISSFIGQQIWIGFRYITDNINSDNGWYIDDIAVITNNGSIFKDSADNFTNWNEKGFSVIKQEVKSNQELGKTGADGFYSLSGLQDSFTLSTGLAGEFVDVFNENGVDAKHYAIITTPSTHDIDWGNDDTSYRKEQSNVFYHINLAHDFFTKGSPFDIYAMNYQTHSYVQFPSTCGAFSDGINIYLSGAGGGCEAASLFSDIIYHEYTHNVIDHVYTIHAPALPYRVESGALNEGLADYFASTINGNHCIAEGLDGDCVRNLNNTYRFPEDVAGETHNDGKIISGSLWDLRKMLGPDISDSLVINSMKLEPFNFSEYLDDIIVADDNNANLEDGTPHLFEICTAFFKNHGIFSPYCSMYYRVPLKVNLLKNPGFESESANWTEYSNTGPIIKKYPMGTYSGKWLAYMGNNNNVHQYIFQDLTIPSGIERAYVQFWYWIMSTETTEDSANDTMRIEIMRPDDDKLLKSLGNLSNLNKSPGYRISEQYDISEFKNKTIRLKLTTTTDPFAPTAFLVDNIALMVVYDTIPPDIDYVPPTPSNNSEMNVNYVNLSIVLNEPGGAAHLFWNGVLEDMDGSGLSFFKNKTGLANDIYDYYVNASDIAGNFNTSEIRRVSVNVTAPGGHISGMKFNDSNGNGTKDPGESSLSNWTIVLKNSTGSTVETMMTDIDGNYTFGGLAAENYTVEEVLQADWKQTFPEAPGKYKVTLAAGENVIGIDFGNNLPPLPSGINATREIENESLRPDESTTITVSIAGNANALALHEIPPEGWNVTRGTDNAEVFKNSTNEWVWKSMKANKTVTYTLTAPGNISIGTYQIEGTIRNANGILANVEGDNSVKIDILEFYRRLGNDPAVVETIDILRAFDDFRNNIVPQGFNRPLSAEEVDEPVNEWRNS